MTIDTVKVKTTTVIKLQEDDDTIDFNSSTHSGQFALDGGDGVDTLHKRRSTFDDTGVTNIP